MAEGNLTDLVVRAAKPKAQPYKLTDGQSMHLLVSTTGARLWRMRYVIGGKEKTLAFGQYPAVTLAEARAMRDAAKRELATGRDPAVALKERKTRWHDATDSFETIARAWFETSKGMWSPVHQSDVITSLEQDVFPQIGRLPIGDLKPKDILAVLKRIEDRPAIETAHRVGQRIARVFDFAAGLGIVETNPATVVKKALKPIRKGRQPAVVTLEEAREVLAAAEKQPAHPVTKLALRFLALTVVRPGVIARTPWVELAGLSAEDPVWHIPAARMKLRIEHKDDPNRDHLVPLSRQAVEVLDAVKILTGRGLMAFPNARFPNRPMSENAMGYLLNRAGFHQRHVPHGWRSTFSTIMNERNHADFAVVEMVLAHTPQNEVAAAYNRARYLTQRRAMLREWADMLLEGMPSAAELLKGPRR